MHPDRALLLAFAFTTAATAAAAAPRVAALHQFADSPDGSNPNAALLPWRGALWGTTLYGGTAGNGSVFATDPATGRTRVVYSFTGGADGGLPFGSLVASGGALYGTTYSGGTGRWGVVFKLTPDGTETVLHAFTDAPDGALPQAGLTLLGGKLYGVTFGGGDSSCNGGTGCGIVFSLTPGGGGADYAVVAGFSNASGWAPTANLVAMGGVLYGTTESGGTYGGGSVFSVTRGGKLTVLHQFGAGTDGNTPSAPLLPVDGVFYGTTATGGTSGVGTVFTITADGQERVITNFGGNAGAQPAGGLLAVGQRLYGTTVEGGSVGAGTVFAINRRGRFTAIVPLDGIPQGASPSASLVASGKTLYGTAYSGGSTACNGFGCGTVFTVTP